MCCIVSIILYNIVRAIIDNSGCVLAPPTLVCASTKIKLFCNPRPNPNWHSKRRKNQKIFAIQAGIQGIEQPKTNKNKETLCIKQAVQVANRVKNSGVTMPGKISDLT